MSQHLIKEVQQLKQQIATLKESSRGLNVEDIDKRVKYIEKFLSEKFPGEFHIPRDWSDPGYPPTRHLD